MSQTVIDFFWDAQNMTYTEGFGKTFIKIFSTIAGITWFFTLVIHIGLYSRIREVKKIIASDNLLINNDVEMRCNEILITSRAKKGHHFRNYIECSLLVRIFSNRIDNLIDIRVWIYSNNRGNLYFSLIFNLSNDILNNTLNNLSPRYLKI